MRQNQKKTLYESIMRDVAKVVKRAINERGAIPTIDRRTNSSFELVRDFDGDEGCVLRYTTTDRRELSYEVVKRLGDVDSHDYGVIEFASEPLYIQIGAFAGCSNLLTVEIPEGVETICNCAFMNARCLKTVTIPSSVTSIGHDAFSGCDNIQYLEYEGTRRDFLRIDIGDYAIEEGTCILCSDGDITL